MAQGEMTTSQTKKTRPSRRVAAREIRFRLRGNSHGRIHHRSGIQNRSRRSRHKSPASRPSLQSGRSGARSRVRSQRISSTSEQTSSTIPQSTANTSRGLKYIKISQGKMAAAFRRRKRAAVPVARTSPSRTICSLRTWSTVPCGSPSAASKGIVSKTAKPGWRWINGWGNSRANEKAKDRG